MSNLILERLFQFAQTAPRQTALQGRNPDTGHPISLSFHQLADEVIRAADTLNQQDVHCLALKADNGLAWAIADLAAMVAGKVLIPVPVFSLINKSGTCSLHRRLMRCGATGQSMSTQSQWRLPICLSIGCLLAASPARCILRPVKSPLLRVPPPSPKGYV
ncbi:hypothetical protein [Photobacterium sp. Hal280]|uniref:hypothetical protein n=1 Tax=Photobacterium sp. Hal280 TaxID=3035163 RepID=UPI00301BD5EE